MNHPHQFHPAWLDIFVQPCPWFRKQLLCFPKFSRLSLELQLLIWEFAVEAEDSTSVTVETKIKYFPRRSGQQEIGYALPSGLLYVCCDARKAATKRWKPHFHAELSPGHPIYFDMSTDWLVFSDFHTYCRTSLTIQDPATETPSAAKVKRVLIRVRNLTYLDDMADFCATFPNLQELRIVEPDRGPNYVEFVTLAHIPSYNQYLEEFPVYADAENMDTHTPQLRTMVEDEIKLRGGSPETWSQPAIMWGTAQQWRRAISLHREEKLMSTLLARNELDDAMDSQHALVIPSLEYEARATNDYQSLEFAERRKKRLTQKPSWYERERFL